jgi:hypothetical protein
MHIVRRLPVAYARSSASGKEPPPMSAGRPDCSARACAPRGPDPVCVVTKQTARRDRVGIAGIGLRKILTEYPGRSPAVRPGRIELPSESSNGDRLQVLFPFAWVRPAAGAKTCKR